MSLTVSPDLLERARLGEVDDTGFLDCVRTSLPYAWELVTGLIAELEAGEAAGNNPAGVFYKPLRGISIGDYFAATFCG